MPSATLGFTGQELVDRVVTYIGNTSTEFSTYIADALIFAEMRFIKAHDWDFLNQTKLSLTVSSGTDEYTLDTASLGFEMKAHDIKNVFDPASGIYLKKSTLNQIRRLDPENDDGSAQSDLQMWAEAGDQKIIVWPPTFETTQLLIDGKITPTPITDLNSYPTVPIDYQETLYEYLLWIALDRENDTRESVKRQEVFDLIQRDINHDEAGLGNTTEPRIRHFREAGLDGSGANLEALLFSPFVFA